MDLPDPTQLAIPGFILLIGLEIFWAVRCNKSYYEPRDTLTSLSLGLGSVVAGLLVGGATFAIAQWGYGHRLFDIGFVWWAWPLAFLLDDLAYYCFHRAAHRVRWFWAAHDIHHSSQHYNLSTALRQTWTGFFAMTFIFRLPLFFIGFPPEMVFFVAGINLVYQFWIHTEIIDRCPYWFEAVMNTPSHHRVHHATNPRYLDSNYAGVFIIWDRMFGTFVAEEELVDGEPDPIRYGIVKQLGSFNVLWAAFHEWIGILRDMWAAPGLGNKLQYLLRPPGWSHDNSRETSDSIKARWAEKQQLITHERQPAE